MSNIAERVKKIVVDKLGVDESLVVAEKEFDLTIADEQAEKITTVGQAIKFLEGELQS